VEQLFIIYEDTVATCSASRAGLLSRAKPIQARLSGDSTQMPTVYEIYGDVNDPMKTDIVLKPNEDVLDTSALECVKSCIARGNADMNFNLLALVPNLGNPD